MVAVAFEGETDPALAGLVDEMVWIRVGQLGKLIAAFKERGIERCVMVGQIAPRNVFDVRPDIRGLALVLRLREKNAHTIFGAVADELAKEGVQLVEATPWLKELMPARGFAIGPRLRKEQEEDVAFGHRLAKEVSRLDIGQTIVVKQGTVLAVEGFEGTDRCLARGGELAGPDGGAVAVKVAKEGHDMRFDIPCLGSRTIEVCAEAGVSVLACEGGRTLLLERAAVEDIARRRKISILAL